MLQREPDFEPERLEPLEPLLPRLPPPLLFDEPRLPPPFFVYWLWPSGLLFGMSLSLRPEWASKHCKLVASGDAVDFGLPSAAIGTALEGRCSRVRRRDAAQWHIACFASALRPGARRIPQGSTLPRDFGTTAHGPRRPQHPHST